MDILLKHLEDAPDKITQESLSNDKYYKIQGIRDWILLKYEW